jgi:predicted permease
VPHTVIGVVPRDKLVPETQFYVPAVAHPSPKGKYSRNFHWATVVGRLRPGVTIEQAERELQAIKRQLDPEYPVWKKDWSAAVRAPRPLLAARTGPVAFALLGAVALVLLIACANVANLLLARAARRESEFALRAALGATSSRLVRQVLTESLVLALLGGVAGVLLASWAIQLLRTATASMLPPALAPQLDLRVLAASLIVAVVTGLLFGALPAWRARRLDVNTALKEGGRSATAGGRGRAQRALIVAEVALSVVLLTSAGLLLRSLAKAVASDPGFQPERVLAFDLSLPAATYPTPESRLQFSKTLQERLRALPGVENVGTAMSLPFAGGGYGEGFSPAEQTPSFSDPTGRLDFVSPGYLETLGARLLAGRWITESDNRADTSRVAIVNDVVAKQLYGGEMPVGRQLRISAQMYEIIGVIGSLPGRNKDAPSPLFAYVPQAFDPSSFSVVVRTPNRPELLIPQVRDVLRHIDPGLPLGHLRTLDRAMVGSLKTRRLIFVLITTFAVSSLILACVGLYGVMSYAVATRTRELSIRLALGALPRDVIRLVLVGGVKLVLIGVGIGLALTLVSTGYLRAQLYNVSAYDPLAVILSIAALFAVAVAACWWPARRATRADALAALRAE